jgi:hypothetical protein
VWLRKMLLLASMSLATIAFAIPATASAQTSQFTHEGLPIGELGVVEEISGPVAFNLAVAPTEGTHCKEVHARVVFFLFFARFISVEFTGCTTTSAESSKNNLVIDPHAIDLENWEIEPDVQNNRLLIKNVHITSTVTAGGVVVGSTTIKGGTMIATIPGGGAEAIETVTLSDEGATAESPSGSAGTAANLSGHLTASGTIGIATAP